MAFRVRITPEGYERLKADLERERERLEQATRLLRELSGTSDDYDDPSLEEAKRAKAQYELRVDELERQLDRADIIEAGSVTEVDLGSIVTLDRGGAEVRVQLVHTADTGVLDSDIPRVSDRSPLGEALKGRSVGDVFKVEINGKTTKYEVKAIG